MKYQNTILILVFICIGGLFRTSFSEPAKSPIWIEMSRTQCYGTCPAYSLIVLADGTVRFHGEAFTIVKGNQESKLNEDQLQKLKQLISSSIFLKLLTDCCNCYDMT